jgi:hypothetical protein
MGKRIDYAKGLPLEIIAHIVSYVAESPKGEQTLRNLLLVDKRYFIVGNQFKYSL